MELGNRHSALSLLAAFSVFVFMGLLVFYADAPSPTGYVVSQVSQDYPIIDVVEFSPGETMIVDDAVLRVDEIGKGSVIVTVEKNLQYDTRGIHEGETVVFDSFHVKLVDTVWRQEGEQLALIQLTR